MPARIGPFGPLAVAASLIAAGCGSGSAPMPASCNRGPAGVARALQRAPVAVRLGDGSALSTCVARAHDDADLQSLGFALTTVADDLAVRARASDSAAVALGYLIGAARRGALHTSGVSAELVRRLEQDAALDGLGAARRAAVQRGMAAGMRTG